MLNINFSCIDFLINHHLINILICLHKTILRILKNSAIFNINYSEKSFFSQYYFSKRKGCSILHFRTTAKNKNHIF